ncbi:MAG: glutathione S-transferase family protein [Azospirillaceae bacterium]
MITVTAFRWVPEFAQGLVRDFRVRWALEEAGLPYRSVLIDPDVQGSAAYRGKQPFGQVPVLEEDGHTLFESGAILLHVARRSEVLLPVEEPARSRAEAWVFAALNSIEIVIQQLAEIDLFHPQEDWARQRRPAVETMVRRRLDELAARLDGRDYLEDRFTAGDLMMAAVLRILRHTEMVTAHDVLGPYLERCLDRPAFRRAVAAQLADFGVTGASAEARPAARRAM